MAFKNQNGNDKPPEQVLDNLYKSTIGNWGVAAPIFVDLGPIADSIRQVIGKHGWIYLNNKLSKWGSNNVVPVTGLERDAEYQAAVVNVVADGRGACVRVLRNDLARATFQKDLEKLLGSLRLVPEKVDLLVDYQLLDNGCPDLMRLCGLLPGLQSWRSFTLAGGVFPPDLQRLKKNEKHEISRSDWLNWSEQVRISGARISRVPIYGDYTIRHPIVAEDDSGFGNPNASASIRYTSDAYWLIMRGEGAQTSPVGRKQYIAQAMLLSTLPEYGGRDYCYGDMYIADMGAQSTKTGSPETWLLAGFNRHMTHTVRQIAKMYGT